MRDIQKAVKDLTDAPRENLDAHALCEELWDSLRPVLAQWSQVQGDKNLKILQDGIDGAAPSASTSTTTTQALEDKMKDYHAAVMAQLQDLHGAVTTTTLNKVDKLHTTVEAVAAGNQNPGRIHERRPRPHRSHQGPSRRVQGVVVPPQRGAREINNHSPIIRDIQKVATRSAEMAERTNLLLGKGDPSPWETELRNVCEDTGQDLTLGQWPGKRS